LLALQNSTLYVGFGKNLNFHHFKKCSLDISAAATERRMELADFSGKVAERQIII